MYYINWKEEDSLYIIYFWQINISVKNEQVLD